MYINPYFQASLSHQQKIHLLKKCFEPARVSDTTFLSYEDLVSHISKLTNGMVQDAEVSMQLYEQVSKNYEGKFALKEYYEVYIQADQILKEKIQTTSQALEDLISQQQEALKRLDVKKNTEKYNSFGIAYDSNLTFHIEEAQTMDSVNPTWQSTGKWMIKIKCGSQSQTTSVFNGKKPVWDEALVFLIESGKEDFQLLLIDYNSLSSDTVYAQSQIYNVKQKLYNQQKTEEFIQLVGVNTNQVLAILHVKMHWLHSRMKYLNQLVHQFDDNINILKHDLVDYQEDLQKLHEPFPLFAEIQNQQQFEQMFVNFDNGQKGIPKIFQPNYPLNTMPKAAYDTFELSYYIAVFTLFMVVLACLNKTQFFDILVLLFYIKINKDFLLDYQMLLICSVSLVVSVALDISWMIAFGDKYFVSPSGVEEYTLYIQVVASVSKLILLCLVSYITLDQKRKVFWIRKNHTNLVAISGNKFEFDIMLTNKLNKQLFDPL